MCKGTEGKLLRPERSFHGAFEFADAVGVELGRFHVITFFIT
jgi:hypothetical protein